MLDLEAPSKKIKSFIYRDQYQKFRLSFTRGYGNVFLGAWQTHSIEFGSNEHECIHMVFDSQFEDGVETFFSEGVVGYYYRTLDSSEWDRKKRFVSEHIEDVPIEQLITDEHRFWSIPEIAYAVSAHFAKFLT